MSAPGPSPDVKEKVKEPRYPPPQSRRTFFKSKFYYKLRYYLRIPISSRLGLFLTFYVGCIGLNNGLTYLLRGPDHPLNNFRWKQMKERGELPPELLEKERLLEAYVKQSIFEPRQPVPQPSIFKY